MGTKMEFCSRRMGKWEAYWGVDRITDIKGLIMTGWDPPNFDREIHEPSEKLAILQHPLQTPFSCATHPIALSQRDACSAH